LWACIQFARKYELCDIITQFEGLSWYYVTHELLPEHRSKHDTPALPSGVFTVIYADPPWEYDFSQSNSRGIEQHYPTMPLDEIKTIKIPSADDAVLFLWATAPKLVEAMAVIQAWGFAYRTDAVWDKGKIGMGYWFRGQHELLLVGTKGNISTPAAETRFSSVIRSPRQEHSRKPALVYEMIEAMFPNQERIELFLRGKPRPGWIGWGIEAE
jgi:N6-adenosine-specific RNA methylase IME4